MAKYILVILIMWAFCVPEGASAFTNYWPRDFGEAEPEKNQYPMKYERGNIYYYIDSSFPTDPYWMQTLDAVVSDWNKVLAIYNPNLPDINGDGIPDTLVRIDNIWAALARRPTQYARDHLILFAAQDFTITPGRDPHFGGVADVFPKSRQVIVPDVGGTTPVSIPTGDAQSSATVANGTLLNWYHTTGSCADRILIVGIASRRGNSGMTSVTYGGTSLTNIRSDTKGVDVRSELWYLVNPPTGTFPVQINSSVANSISAGASTFCNISQSNPIATHTGGFNIGAATSSNVQINSSVGEVVVDTIATQAAGATVTVGLGQVELWNKKGTWNNAASSSKPGSGSTSMSWNLAYAEWWAQSVVSLNPATTAVATPTPAPTLMPTFISACISCAVPAGCSLEGGSCNFCGTLVCPTPTPTTTTTQGQTYSRVFVTSTSYTGNLGGLVGADDICQTRANAASIGGTWKAWLSSTTVSAASRLVQSTNPYRRIDDVTVANNWADLTDGNLANAIIVTELGQTSFSVPVWTNTTISGGIKDSTLTDPPFTVCQNWTSGVSGGPVAYMGAAYSTYTDQRWTDSSYTACSLPGSLYCFEQTTVAPAPTPTPTPSPTPTPTAMYPNDLVGSPSPEPTACVSCPAPPPGCNWEGSSCNSCGTLVCPTPTPTPTPTPAPPCSVTSASWNSPANPVPEGTPVNLNATLTGDCAGKQITFDLRQNVTLFPDTSISTITTPIVGSSAQVSWTTVAGINTCLIGTCESQFFFNAQVVGAGTPAARSADPMLTVSQVPSSTPAPAPTPTLTPTPTPSCINGYKDNDKDGFGAGVFGCYSSSPSYDVVSDNTDCYDSNSNARPGQQGYYSVHRGDGSFDYDCSATIQRSGCGSGRKCSAENMRSYGDPRCTIRGNTVLICKQGSYLGITSSDCGRRVSCTASSTFSYQGSCIQVPRAISRTILCR